MNRTMVCNFALDLIGANEIMNVDNTADDSKEVVYCARYLDQSRRVVLSAERWNCIEQTNYISPIRVEDNIYVFKLPENLLRMLCLDDPDAVVKGREVKSRISSLGVYGLWDNPNFDELSPVLIDCISADLASRLATALIRDTKVKQEMLDLKRELISTAESEIDYRIINSSNTYLWQEARL